MVGATQRQFTVFASITPRWSLHRAGRQATWHPSSQLSPGNETCDRNQPATSRLPLPPPPFHLSPPSFYRPLSAPLPTPRPPSLVPSLPHSSPSQMHFRLRRTCESTQGNWRRNRRDSPGGNCHIHRVKREKRKRAKTKGRQITRAGMIVSSYKETKQNHRRQDKKKKNRKDAKQWKNAGRF